jgi:hypothetical protein
MRLTKKGVQVMRDYKTVGIRLNKQETAVIERLARGKELTVSELVRLWLQEAAKQERRQQQIKNGNQQTCL